MDLWDTCREQLPDLNLERESFEWLISHQDEFIYSFAKMSAVVTSSTELNTVTAEWRDQSKTVNFVTREIIVHLWENRKPIKVSHVVDSIGFLVSESVIKKCFREGVKLKLLSRSRSGYSATELFKLECLLRMLEKSSRKEVEMWYELMHTYRSLRSWSDKLDRKAAMPR